MNEGCSIFASSTTASLKLPFGKVFEISINAENFVGLSEKFAPNADGEEVSAAASLRVNTALPTGVTAPVGSTYINSAKINRMVIDYDLNGGVLTLADTDEEFSGHFIDYKSIYDFAADARGLPTPALLAIDNTDLDDSTKNRLVSGPNTFIKWIQTSGAAFADTASLTYAGISVKASYDPDSLVSYEIKDLYDEITATVKSGDTDITNGEIVRTSNTALPLTFAATHVPADSNVTPVTVDWIKVKVTGPNGKNVYTSGKEDSPHVYNLSKHETTGVYTAVITAHVEGKKQSETYSYTCTFNVKDN